MSWWWYERFPRSTPRKAKGGIKAQSKRGAIGQTWWGKRWVQVLESFDIGARLSRGKSYARGGQVLSIDIDKGKVTAKVQGSMPKPYSVQIELKPLTAAQWKKVADALAQQALFAAKLLAGELPAEVDQVFQDNGLSLFPGKSRDLQTDCSCPDYSNPCKHIAAVYYLLAEEFDRDPFLLFKLRGMTREELVALLGESAPAEAAPSAEQTPAAAPLPSDATTFWGAAPLPDDLFGEVAPPPADAALLKRLGNFPFWRGNERFLDALTPVYRQASPAGLDVFLGDKQGQ